MGLARMAGELGRYLTGWRSYIGYCQTPSVLHRLDEWVRQRLRSVAWKQWRGGRTRYAELRRGGVSPALAAQTAGSGHGPWRLGNRPALSLALPHAYFDVLGLPHLTVGR